MLVLCLLLNKSKHRRFRCRSHQTPFSHPQSVCHSVKELPTFFTDQTDSSDGQPPQTPHTADCIAKIQAIQRDVLELMCAVEQFGGQRNDKDYMYLDEMLTRNLLKLDTIDTNGKESIRLARKEAIKCIQASIAVLDAKASLNLNENQSGEPTTADADQNNQVNGDASVKDDGEKIAASDGKSVTAEGNGEPVPEMPEDVQQIVERISLDDKSKEPNDADQSFVNANEAGVNE